MIALLLLFVTCFILLAILSRKPVNLPPGDWGYPFIGNIVFGRDNMKNLIKKNYEKHGDLFCIKMGSRIYIFLAEFQLIKDALSKEVFSGRPNFQYLLKPTNNVGDGVIGSNGHLWQRNRRFTLKTLRDFGFGKSTIEEVIAIEVQALLNNFAKFEGKPFKFGWIFHISALNVLWQLVANKRHDFADKEVQFVLNHLRRTAQINNGPIVLMDYLPWISKIMPKFLKDSYMKLGELDSIVSFYRQFLEKEILIHAQNLDRENPKDLIDIYLLDIAEENIKPNFIVQKDLCNLISLVKDLFSAGSGTTASTLKWIMLYMCKYPEVQLKVQREIDFAVSKERLPSLQDKDKLAFLEATISEVNRLISFAPNALHHMVTEDCTLKNFKIPKGSVIMPCLDLCHQNSKYFEAPEEFRPERFLDSKGKYISKKDGYAPFSIGRRSCLGESLAKTELLLFTAAILQNYEISAPQDEMVDLTPKQNESFLLNYPQELNVIIHKRIY